MRLSLYEIYHQETCSFYLNVVLWHFIKYKCMFSKKKEAEKSDKRVQAFVSMFKSLKIYESYFYKTNFFWLLKLNIENGLGEVYKFHHNQGKIEKSFRGCCLIFLSWALKKSLTCVMNIPNLKTQSWFLTGAMPRNWNQ